MPKALNGFETKQLQFKGRKFDAEAGVFEGYASVFGNIDSDGDIIEKGAYAEFLADDWSRVKIMALHNDQWLPIGKPLKLFEDDVGLYIKAKISDTSMGLDIRQLMKDGVLDELSIGFVLLDYFMDDDGNRHLTKIILQEVSVVTWAANDKAKILDVKAQSNASATSPDALLELAGTLEKQASTLRLQAEHISGKSENMSKNEPVGKKSYTLPATLSGKSKHRLITRKNSNFRRKFS